MSDELTQLLHATAERLLADQCDRATLAAAEEGGWPEALWQALEEAGLPLALAPEAAGGAGLGVADALGLIGVAARHAAPVPFAETVFASWLLLGAGLPLAPGPLTAAPVIRGDRLTLRRAGQGWRLDGKAARVPWARHATRIVVLAAGEDGRAMIAGVPHGAGVIRKGANLAMEPRDDVAFDGLALPAEAVAPAGVGPAQMRAFGAALRTVQIAGALARALELCVGYAQQRVQFGRPIGRFQAVQQNLAALASEAAVASAAAGLAAEAAARDRDPLVIGAAKGRAAEAASTGAAIAHQVHGAIGFTWEYALNFSTRRLWSWRDEFGNEAEWYLQLGARVAASAVEDQLWPTISALGVAAPQAAGG
jgi:acyl-CoA dehydrogenase